MQQTETDERWYVQFDSGQVQLMTLEELDAAFEAGDVHENTFVIQVGESEWQTLADVAGLGDEEESSEPEAEAEPETTTLYTPAQAASLHTQAAPVSRGPAPPPIVARAPVAQAAVAVPSARPAVVAAAAGGWPPVATPAAPQSSWPPPAMSRPSSGYNLGPQSTIPVVNDLDTDFGTPSFKSGRRTAFVAVLAAIPVLGGGGYALTRLDMPPERPALAAAAPVTPQTSNPWKPPAPTAAPAAAPAPTPTPSETKSDSASSGRLSDDMKKALLASDSSRAASKAKTKAAAPTRRSGGSSKQSGSSVFKSGGSANDPLNSKL